MAPETLTQASKTRIAASDTQILACETQILASDTQIPAKRQKPANRQTNRQKAQSPRAWRQLTWNDRHQLQWFHDPDGA